MSVYDPTLSAVTRGADASAFANHPGYCRMFAPSG
jgi:hypothetical protein